MANGKAKTIILCASDNIGVGLWTSICLGFANIFGCECLSYKRKTEKVVNSVKQKLLQQIITKPEYEFGDISLACDSPLTYTGTVIGTLKSEYQDVQEAPKPQNQNQKPANPVSPTGVDETNYQKAISLLYSKKFDEAKAIFVSLGNYKDSVERAKSCDTLKQLYLQKVGK